MDEYYVPEFESVTSVNRDITNRDAFLAGVIFTLSQTTDFFNGDSNDEEKAQFIEKIKSMDENAMIALIETQVETEEALEHVGDW